MWGNLFILEDLFFLPEVPFAEDSLATTEQERDLNDIRELQRIPMTVEEVQDHLRSIQSGSVITLTKQLCYQAYEQASARIAEPMYRCVLQCSSDQLGKLYTVLNQRRGIVQNEDIWEGTDIFTITCSLPVTES